MNKCYLPKIVSEFRMAYDQCIRKALAAEGLNDFDTSYGLIVKALNQKEKLTMKELAQEIGRDKSTVTVLARKLKDKNYVMCIDNPSDHRSKLIVLTDKAKAIVDTLYGISDQVNSQIWCNFDDDEAEQFLASLLKVTENLKQCTCKSEKEI